MNLPDAAETADVTEAENVNAFAATSGPFNRLYLEGNLKVWDLNETTTRWDYAAAAPSDQILHIQFGVLAGILAVVSLACILLIVSILRLKSVRSNSFNMYLLTITVPDLVSSGSCFLTCAMSSAAYRYYSEQMCGWQSFYLVWGFSSNCWMNAVIAHQLFTMLRISHNRGRYHPPTRKRVWLQACAVYLYSCVIALLAAFPVPGLPYRTGLYSGFACFPKDYDTASTYFWWLVFLPAFLVIPLIYVLYCSFLVYKRSYLPPKGRRRNLAVYFFRLVFVFVFMWVPFIFIAFIYTPIASRNYETAGTSSWVFWVAAVISHTQGLVSVCISLTKPDVRKAMMGTVTCGWYDKVVEREQIEKEREREARRQGRLNSMNHTAQTVSLMASRTSLPGGGPGQRRVSFSENHSSTLSDGNGHQRPQGERQRRQARSSFLSSVVSLPKSILWWGSTSGESIGRRGWSTGSSGFSSAEDGEDASGQNQEQDKRATLQTADSKSSLIYTEGVREEGKEGEDGAETCLNEEPLPDKENCDDDIWCDDESIASAAAAISDSFAKEEVDNRSDEQSKDAKEASAMEAGIGTTDDSSPNETADTFDEAR